MKDILRSIKEVSVGILDGIELLLAFFGIIMAMCLYRKCIDRQISRQTDRQIHVVRERE